MYDSKTQYHMRCMTANLASETRRRYCQSNLLVVPNVLRGRSKEILNFDSPCQSHDNMQTWSAKKESVFFFQHVDFTLELSYNSNCFMSKSKSSHFSQQNQSNDPLKSWTNPHTFEKSGVIRVSLFGFVWKIAGHQKTHIFPSKICHRSGSQFQSQESDLSWWNHVKYHEISIFRFSP